MKRKLRIAVIHGGRSGEHAVSLVSARSILRALDREKYDAVPVKIGRDGRWTIGARRLAGKGAPATDELRRFDVLFPIVHGTDGEDGVLQGLMELSGVPYVGSGVLGSAIGMDKILQKKVFEAEGFPVAAYVHFGAADYAHDADAVLDRIEKRLAYPCFVKPSNMGSSVGISKAHHRKELRRAVAEALRYDARVVVEAAVPEAREIECAVLGNAEPRTSVLGEIVPSGEFYDYAAKYVDGKSRTVIPADLPRRTAENVRAMAARAFRALDCAGLARVDFFVRRDSGEVYLNEINTLPGFTSISMYPKLWEASGLAYPALLDEIVRLAIARHRTRAALTRVFRPPTRRKDSRRTDDRRNQPSRRNR